MPNLRGKSLAIARVSWSLFAALTFVACGTLEGVQAPQSTGYPPPQSAPTTLLPPPVASVATSTPLPTPTPPGFNPYPYPMGTLGTPPPTPTPKLYPEMYTAAIETYFARFRPNVSVAVAYIQAEPGVPDAAVQLIKQHLEAAQLTVVGQEQAGGLIISITAEKQDPQVGTVGYPTDTPTIGLSTSVSGNVMSSSGIGYALIQHQSGWEAAQYVFGMS